MESTRIYQCHWLKKVFLCFNFFVFIIVKHLRTFGFWQELRVVVILRDEWSALRRAFL